MSIQTLSFLTLVLLMGIVLANIDELNKIREKSLCWPKNVTLEEERMKEWDNCYSEKLGVNRSDENYKEAVFSAWATKTIRYELIICVAINKKAWNETTQSINFEIIEEPKDELEFENDQVKENFMNVRAQCFFEFGNSNETIFCAFEKSMEVCFNETIDELISEYQIDDESENEEQLTGENDDNINKDEINDNEGNDKEENEDVEDEENIQEAINIGS